MLIVTFMSLRGVSETNDAAIQEKCFGLLRQAKAFLAMTEDNKCL